MANTDEYVLITGASAGIGYELAKLFARDGYNLFLVARSEDDLKRVSEEISSSSRRDVRWLSADLFDPASPQKIYDAVRSANLRVYILVNNAGQGEYGLFEETDIDRELDIIQLNISSVVSLTKLFLPDLISKGGGKILNTSSVASRIPGPWQSVYHGTKAFIQSWTEAIRYELKDRGITVTALLPGATDTDFFAKADMLDSKIVQDPDNLSDPEQVAKDGYKALMAGEDLVISGFKNKLQMAGAKLMSDKSNAKQIAKQQEPASDK